MAIRILLNESGASLRCVPIWCVQSNGTSSATNESGRTFFFSLGGVDYGSGGSLSVISANAGLYSCNFSASKVSVTGQGQVYYSSGTALPVSTPIEVVPYNSFDSMRLGLFALPNAAAEAAGGLITSGTGSGQLSVSAGSVGLKAQTHSQATVGGADNLGRREYSDITLRIGLVDYSGATVGVGNIKAGTYSGVSVEVKTGGIQVASVGKGAYSGVSFEVTTGGIQTASIGVGNYSGVSLGVLDIKPASYSGVTVGIDNIKGASYSGVTIQGLSNYANISNVTLAAGTHSNVTIQGVTRINSGVTLNADVHSGASVEIKTGGIQTTSIGKGAYSGVSLEVTTGGIQVASVGKGSYSGVTVGIDNIKGASYSDVTIQGVTRTLSLSANDDKTGYGLAAGSYSGVTIDGLSNKTFFQTSVQSSVWSGKRSDWTTPGSFGEYVYSQVTGTSTGTVQGVTRALNLSGNDDKTGYSISGTKTTLDALNDINGSGVTLHVGTHSGATVQGVTRLNSSVTLNADTHSGATIAGIVDGGIIANTLASGAITSAKFAAGAIDAVALATDAGLEIADALLARDVSGGATGGRSVSQALYTLRNKVDIQGSTLTVYQVDDTTSSWTATITTGTNPISGVDPTT